MEEQEGEFAEEEEENSEEDTQENLTKDIKEEFIPQSTHSLISVYEEGEFQKSEEEGEEEEFEEEEEKEEIEEEVEREEEKTEAEEEVECEVEIEEEEWNYQEEEGEVEGEEEYRGEAEESESKEKSGRESVATSEALSNVYAKLSPFTVKWSFGLKKNVGLINLTTSSTFEVFCASSHFGVLYNYSANTMTFLPGHNFQVTSLATDATGRWLVSADAGEDTVIVIWDNMKRIPVWSLYNVFPGGTKCVRISQDARFLAAVNCNFNYTLKFWLWTHGREEPDGVMDLDPAYGKVKHINFNHMHTEQFAVTMASRVVFYEWTLKSKTLETFSPEMPKKKVGNFRGSLFLDDNHTAITSTSQGYIIVWCDVKYSDPILDDVPGTIDKKYLKHLRIQQTGITSLQLCDGIIASTSEDGTILFHDQYLRLMYWLPKLKFEPLVCMSFNLALIPMDSDPFSPDFDESGKSSLSDEEVQNIFEYEEPPTEKPYKGAESSLLPGNLFPKEKSEKDLKNPSDCTVEGKPFALRDFMFLTTTGKVGYVSHRRKKVKYFLSNPETPIISMDCNPNRDHIVMGSSEGRLSLYEYQLKKLLVFAEFPDPVTTLRFSHLGHSLMAGLQNGSLLELDPLFLTVKRKIEQSKSPLQKVCYSQNDELLAYYDEFSTVYVHMKKPGVTEWSFMGSYISHYKPIVDILFQDPQDDGQARLFTIGKDRMLVEYDMNNLEDNKLKLVSLIRIEQTAIPCSFLCLDKFSKTPQFIVSNDEYKLKILDADSHMCQKTTLGPTADTPINFMRTVSDWDGNSNNIKMVYATDKHIGLRILPPTGNPFEGMGMVAHPEKIFALALSHEHRYIFTVGPKDVNVLMWELNPGSVDVASQIGGIGLEPFVSLIEGGPNSFLFKEIEDFFYYAQIIHQGEDPNLDRSVAKTLSLCEIPDLFRSLGYYPTNYEIDNLLYELKHFDYEKTGQFTSEVTFEECVKAFLNHRPAYGISIDNINTALLKIADSTDPSDIIIERDELYRALEEKAEGMTHAEAVGYLCILLLPKDENNPVPASMNINEFAENVLGIDLNITEENVRQITHAFEAKNA